MNTLSHNPAFVAYAIACLVLCGNLLFLWGYSGAVRSKAKSTPNSEDVAIFGGALAEADPPAIARILRAHSNAQASVYPFLFLGLIYVLAGGGAALGAAYFTVFSAARLLHSYAYIAGKQPWRTIFFVTGALATGVLMVNDAWLILAAH
jgi:prostaglandin-E synthase 1